MKILIAEDNFLVSMQLEELLGDLGCEVLGPFASAEDALSALESEQVQGALLDFSLRNGNSIPIAQELLNRGCPFVFVTGYVGDDAFAPPFDTVKRFAKPFNEVKLKQAIKEFA